MKGWRLRKLEFFCRITSDYREIPVLLWTKDKKFKYQGRGRINRHLRKIGFKKILKVVPL